MTFTRTCRNCRANVAATFANYRATLRTIELKFVRHRRYVIYVRMPFGAKSTHRRDIQFDLRVNTFTIDYGRAFWRQTRPATLATSANKSEVLPYIVTDVTQNRSIDCINFDFVAAVGRRCVISWVRRNKLRRRSVAYCLCVVSIAYFIWTGKLIDFEQPVCDSCQLLTWPTTFGAKNIARAHFE